MYKTILLGHVTLRSMCLVELEGLYSGLVL